MPRHDAADERRLLGAHEAMHIFDVVLAPERAGDLVRRGVAGVNHRDTKPRIGEVMDLLRHFAPEELGVIADVAIGETSALPERARLRERRAGEPWRGGAVAIEPRALAHPWAADRRKMPHYPELDFVLRTRYSRDGNFSTTLHILSLLKEDLAMSDQSSGNRQLGNALKLVADVAIMPGASQLVEGKVAEGALYGVAALAGKVLIGPLLGPLFWVPWVAVGLNSFSRSVDGKNLWELNPHTANPQTGSSSVRS